MSSITIQKKKRKISQGLQELIDKANEYHDKAGEVIKEAYDYAIKVDGYSPKEARVELYKNLDYTPRWIRKHLPKEALETKFSHKPKSTSKEDDSNINQAEEELVPPIDGLNISPENEGEDDDEDEGDDEEQDRNHKWNLANIAINKYFEALTGHFLADGEQFYTKEHVIQSKTFRSELVKSLKPHEATKIRKELIVLQYLTQEVLKLIEEGKISK